MTKVINLYGGPGTGKSTSASYLFFLMKQAGINCELVNEYVKQWAWEDRLPVNYDQFYFFGKQARKEYTLFSKLDYIVTDSPVALIPYYTQIYGTLEQAECFNEMLKTYHNMCASQGVEHIHVFLKRYKKYNHKGRFNSEEEARRIDGEIKWFLEESNIPFIEIDATKEGIEAFFENIKSHEV